MSRYRSFADAAETPETPRMVPVEIVTRPTYESPEEKARWEAATHATPRRNGEGMFEWFERIGAAVRGDGPVAGEQLSLRDPGEEG